MPIYMPIPQKACEQLRATCMFCRYRVPLPLLNPSEWPSENWDREKAKAREQNPFIESDAPKIKAGNPSTDLVGALPFQNLKMQPDRKDKKAPEVSTTPIPMLEQGTVGTAPEDSISKLNMVPTEQDETAACKLRLQIEEAKYKLYNGQLSPEESNMETGTDESEYPFLD